MKLLGNLTQIFLSEANLLRSIYSTYCDFFLLINNKEKFTKPNQINTENILLFTKFFWKFLFIKKKNAFCGTFVNESFTNVTRKSKYIHILAGVLIFVYNIFMVYGNSRQLYNTNQESQHGVGYVKTNSPIKLLIFFGHY